MVVIPSLPVAQVVAHPVAKSVSVLPRDRGPVGLVLWLLVPEERLLSLLHVVV